MIYGSVCSGIEAATMAWHPLGWSPAFFSEVEAFPCAVLKHHYGRVPNHGDMTKFEEWPDHAIDLLVGGTPCQSFSVAGLRQGLADPRGNLMLTYLAIARRYQPRWLVWENVPGVLSSNGGRDFGTFIRGLEECGYHAAWRVLDAQYVRVDGFERAVPQRRRRVFVVGYLGDWRRAAAVLFEPEGMRGDSPPRREAGKGIARDVAPCLDSSFGRLQGQSGQDLNHGHGHLVPQAFGGNNTSGPIDVATACQAHGGPPGRLNFESETFIAHATVPFDTTQITSKANYSQPKPGDPCHPLAAGAHPPAVAFTCSEQANSFAWERDVYPTLSAQIPNDTSNIQIGIRQGWAVRRLTPTECERLQGFPDQFTNIPWRGKPTAPDGPRYKALGNSMAINCMRWIGQRIDRVEAMRIEEVAA